MAESAEDGRGGRPRKTQRPSRLGVPSVPDVTFPNVAKGVNQSQGPNTAKKDFPTKRQNIASVLLQAFLVCIGALLLDAAAQNPAALTVSPGKATMLVGESRTFRAVGKDGRIRHNVRWEISPQNAAAILGSGDEVTVQAREASPSVLLTAYAEGDTADATIEIRPAGDMPAGTTLWSVAPTPGCKATKMTQAVPSANGPDLYVVETCPEGTVIRALTADGRELWRRRIGGGGDPSQKAAGPVASGPYAGFMLNGPAATVKPKAEEPPAEHIHSRSTSVCDAIAVGMTRELAARAVSERGLALDAKQREGNAWLLEEEGYRCTISFDEKTGAVVKKKKTVVTD